MGFDWQTEEDGEWDDFDITSTDPNEQEPNRLRRWLYWLILLGLLLMALKNNTYE